MSGILLKTCWAFNEWWNNKFCYKVASCWLFLLNRIYHLPTVWSRSANVSTRYRTKNLVKLTKSKVIQCRNINRLTTNNTTAKQVKRCKVKYISKSVNLKCERINKNLVIIMIYRRKVTNTFVCSYHVRHTKSTYNENLQQKQGGLSEKNFLTYDGGLTHPHTSAWLSGMLHSLQLVASFNSQLVYHVYYGWWKIHAWLAIHGSWGILRNFEEYAEESFSTPVLSFPVTVPLQWRRKDEKSIYLLIHLVIYLQVCPSKVCALMGTVL